MLEKENNTVCPRFPFGSQPGELEPEYARLRRESPVARVELPYGGQAWLLTRMSETKSALGDPRFSRQAMRGDVPRYIEAEIPDDGSLSGLPSMDAPQHLRTRRLIAQAFTNRRIEAMRPRLTEIVDDLLDRMMAKGRPADLVADFAAILPANAVCLLLGVSYDEWDALGGHVATLMKEGTVPGEQVFIAWQSLRSRLEALTVARRAEPGDDLVSALTQATVGDDSFTDEEIVDHISVIFAAGYETTKCQIVSSVCALLRYPDQLAWLSRNLDAVPQAVEELLRYVPLTDAGVLPSVAMEDVELGGVLIPKGDVVYPCPVSANRDETVFDRADELDLRRSVGPNRHMAFGHGPHLCVGAPLARMELQIALGAILRRMPEIKLAVPEEQLPLKPGLVIRGYDLFPISW
ncbi:cytochrome P450 [Nocardia sp. NPDC046473]|uniref:cytochrome P450 n=1 Tax=Nocardia sp. NPDC046473 TaxID=3155733 RepID=UPI0033D6A21A